MLVASVAVIGCGTMGAGIAQVCARAKLPVLVTEMDEDALEGGMERIRAFLDQGVTRGKVAAEERDAVLAGIVGTTRLEDLADCDLVIEAVAEDMDLKVSLFRRLDEVCKASCVFASNTSSLNITSLARETSRPGSFIGLHFFNPAPLMPLVEVVRTKIAKEKTVSEGIDFIRRLGKEPIVCDDQPGFIVNRLITPFLNEAMRALDGGLASPADIDKAIRLGLGHPMGPFELLDMVGLDTSRAVARSLHEQTRDPQFASPPLLDRMLQDGALGRKTGRGFFDYSPKRESND